MFQCLYDLTDLNTDHVFHTNIIADCQYNRYVWFAIYTDLFTLKCQLTISRTPLQKFVKVPFYHSHLGLLVILPLLHLNSFFYFSTSYHKNNVNYFKVKVNHKNVDNFNHIISACVNIGFTNHNPAGMDASQMHL